MKLGQTAPLILFIDLSRKMAALAVADGSRAKALQYAHSALGAGQKAGTAPRLTAPRSLAAMGFTFAALARSPVRAAEDREAARNWLHQSLDAWRQAQSDPAFGPTHRKEMRDVEETLAVLEKKP